jgi:hypothetical protein
MEQLREPGKAEGAKRLRTRAMQRHPVKKLKRKKSRSTQ